MGREMGAIKLPAYRRKAAVNLAPRGRYIPEDVQLKKGSQVNAETHKLVKENAVYHGYFEDTKSGQVFVSCQRIRSRNDVLILLARRSLDSLPRPIPANECTVEPPMLRPAIPVDAMTATAPGSSAFNAFIISRRRIDFPVPFIHSTIRTSRRTTNRLTAGPVKNTDFLSRTISRTFCCSRDSLIGLWRCTGGAGITTASIMTDCELRRISVASGSNGPQPRIERAKVGKGTESSNDRTGGKRGWSSINRQWLLTGLSQPQ
ncbi:hypothetical protein FB451DRAFT_611332 [Mycena latifolia]|nr:hypothetical protein FB451DRAFT_611332 [Mycena latifolia]